MFVRKYHNSAVTTAGSCRCNSTTLSSAGLYPNPCICLGPASVFIVNWAIIFSFQALSNVSQRCSKTSRSRGVWRTHPSFQHRSQVGERQEKMSSIHVLIMVFVPTVNPEDHQAWMQTIITQPADLSLLTKVTDKLLHSRGNLAQFPGKKWNCYRSTRYLPVLELLPWMSCSAENATLVIYPRCQFGLSFLLSGFFWDEDKHVVAKYKVYLQAWKWRVKFTLNFRASVVTSVFISCVIINTDQFPTSYFFLSADTFKTQ